MSEDKPALSIGAVLGDSDPVNRAWKREINALSRKVEEISAGVSTPLRVNVIYHVDGRLAPNEFAGMPSDNEPVVPALGIQSEYGFSVSPWWLSGGSSLSPQPSPEGPDPMRERRTGFESWRKAGVDSMMVVPRASTHLEYTDIPLVLPASRWGQALSSVYTQLWLDRYLKHRDNTRWLLGRHFRYLEPVGGDRWAPVRVRRSLSFYYCSAYDLGRRRDLDVTDVGC